MDQPTNIAQKYRIGELDQRVQILAPTEAQGTNGEFTLTWGEYGTFWAQVTPAGGSEQIVGDMLQPVSRARFVFRYDSTVTEKYRLVWNSHTYNVTSIEVIPRNRFLIIFAESMSLSGSAGVDYGNFYLTNSLKIRQVTASAVTTVTPSQAQITSDIGLTAPAAGQGYIAMIKIVSLTRMLMVYSDGTNWFYAYVA